MEKWLTGGGFERRPRASRSGLPMCTEPESLWRLEPSEQLREVGHEVIVANVRELRAISHSDRKSDTVDAEKLARYARLDPEILRPIAHRMALIRATTR